MVSSTKALLKKARIDRISKDSKPVIWLKVVRNLGFGRGVSVKVKIGASLHAQLLGGLI